MAEWKWFFNHVELYTIANIRMTMNKKKTISTLIVAFRFKNNSDSSTYRTQLFGTAKESVVSSLHSINVSFGLVN